MVLFLAGELLCYYDYALRHTLTYYVLHDKGFLASWQFSEQSPIGLSQEHLLTSVVRSWSYS